MNKRILHLIIILLGTWGGGLGGKLLTTEAIAQGVQPGAAVQNYGGAGAPGACTAGGTDRPVVYQGVLYQCVGGTYTALATSATASIAGTIASGQVAYGAGANTIQGSASLTYTTDASNSILQILASSGAPQLAVASTGTNDLYVFRGYHNTTTEIARIYASTARMDVYSLKSASALRLVTNSGDVQVLTDNGASYSFYINTNKQVSIGSNSITAQFDVNVGLASRIGQIIKLAASQSADAFQVQDSSANVLANINSAGVVRAPRLILRDDTSHQALVFQNNAGSARWEIDNNDTLLDVYDYTNTRIFSRLRPSTYSYNFASNVVINWASTTDAGNTGDIGIARNAAGILEINNGTAGTYRDLYLRNAGFSTAPTTNYTIDTNGSLAGNASQQGGARINWTSTGTNTYSSIGRGIDVLYVSGVIDSATNYNGIYVLPQLAAGTTTVTNVTGVQTYTGYGYTTNTNSVTNAIGVLVKSWGNIVPASAFTNQAGVVIGALAGATNNTHLLIGTGSVPSGTFGAYILSSAATAIPLAIKLAASQSADALQVQKSDGTVYLKVNSVGVIDLPSTTFATQYGYILKNGNRFIHDFSYGNNGTVTPTGLNLFVGLLAGNLTTGSTATNTYEASLNVGIGPQVLQNVTTGYNNMGLGAYALNQVTVGAGIVGVGANAFYQVTGSFNVGIGANVGYDLLSGTYNTFIGGNTGRGVTTGGKNTIVGAQVTGLAAGLANTVIIADGDGNKRIYIPSTGVIQINGAGTLGLYENAAGVLEINNGTAGTYRDWRARAAGLGAAPASGTQTLIITPSATTEIPLLVKQIASQTAKSFDIQNSSGTSLTSIDFNGNFFAGPSTIETFTTNASALGTLNYYTDSQTIYYDTAAATGNVTLNVKAAAGTNLDSRLATGQAITFVLKITNTGTPYNIAALNIDGGAQTIKWLGGSAPSGNANAVDTYTFYVYKTGTGTFYVEAAQQSFK